MTGDGYRLDPSQLFNHGLIVPLRMDRRGCSKEKEHREERNGNSKIWEITARRPASKGTVREEE